MPRRIRVLTPEEVQTLQQLGYQKTVIDSLSEIHALTPKQMALAKQILENPGASALTQVTAAGYAVTNGSQAAVVKGRLTGKLGITLRNFGIIEETLARVASDCLQATTTHLVTKRVRNEKGVITKEEVEYHDTPDYRTRLMMFKVLCALGDYFPAKKIDLRKGKSGVDNPLEKLASGVLERFAEELEEKYGDQIDPSGPIEATYEQIDDDEADNETE